MATSIVAARDTVGGFTSVDDLSVLIGCAPQSLDLFQDIFVFAE